MKYPPFLHILFRFLTESLSAWRRLFHILRYVIRSAKHTVWQELARYCCYQGGFSSLMPWLIFEISGVNNFLIAGTAKISFQHSFFNFSSPDTEFICLSPKPYSPKSWHCKSSDLSIRQTCVNLRPGFSGHSFFWTVFLLKAVFAAKLYLTNTEKMMYHIQIIANRFWQCQTRCKAGTESHGSFW